MRIIQLTPEYELQAFNCGDEDLTEKDENEYTRLMYFDMIDT